MFHTIRFEKNLDMFTILKESVQFEQVTKGRWAAILVDCDMSIKNPLVPMIRSTTKYQNASQCFSETMKNLKDNVINASKEIVGESIEFNNAMMELYTCEYKTMGFHCDQMLDLDQNSWIAIYSCYSDSLQCNQSHLRKLVVKKKNTEECVDIIMEPNSVVLFDMNINRHHLHKIVPCDVNQVSNVEWIGVTFRMSHTFVSFVENVPTMIKSNCILHLANDLEKKEFFKNRSRENSLMHFIWDHVDFTISSSDLMLPSSCTMIEK